MHFELRMASLGQISEWCDIQIANTLHHSTFWSIFWFHFGFFWFFFGFCFFFLNSSSFFGWLKQLFPKKKGEELFKKMRKPKKTKTKPKKNQNPFKIVVVVLLRTLSFAWLHLGRCRNGATSKLATYSTTPLFGFILVFFWFFFGFCTFFSNSSSFFGWLKPLFQRKKGRNF